MSVITALKTNLAHMTELGKSSASIESEVSKGKDPIITSYRKLRGVLEAIQQSKCHQEAIKIKCR